MIGGSNNDYAGSRVLSYGMTHFGFLWRIVNSIPRLARWVNRRLITRAVERSASRPNPFSTLVDYTSWESLTDKTWFGRHLKQPPTPEDEQSEAVDRLPPIDRVVQLFDRRRRGANRPVESEKSTLLFPSFAQWFTDGFLLTDPEHRLKTHTNHEIDLSALYGLKKVQTDSLRLRCGDAGRRGRLKSQIIGGEEYAPYLYSEDGLSIRPEFPGLHAPQHLPPVWLPEKRRTLFAFGGARANSTPQTAMFSTLFLREHNRLAGMLERAHPDWDDDRVFETARNTNIVLLLKIVIEEYINHISPYHFLFLADPWAAWSANWNRPNWCAVEFNLLYRWHSLVPSEIEWDGARIPLTEWLFDSSPLTSQGLANAFVQTSRQKAGRLGLHNTPEYLLRTTEGPSIEQGRKARLGSYNDYRVAFGFPPAKTFEDINDDPDIARELREVYVEPGRVEFYVGLFAESPRHNAAVMSLIGRFVALDAFSQALTNPLLSQHVFNDKTFGAEGLNAIESTHTLDDILRRNVPAPGEIPPGAVTMTQKR